MIRKLFFFAAFLTVVGSTPFAAQATPTNDRYVWQIWAYVDSYREKNTGDVLVTFEDSAGNSVTRFPDSSGTNQCPSDPNMIVHRDHPLFERLSKALLSAGLGRKLVKIAYEGVSGKCYAKMVTLRM